MEVNLVESSTIEHLPRGDASPPTGGGNRQPLDTIINGQGMKKTLTKVQSVVHLHSKLDLSRGGVAGGRRHRGAAVAVIAVRSSSRVSSSHSDSLVLLLQGSRREMQLCVQP